MQLRRLWPLQQLTRIMRAPLTGSLCPRKSREEVFRARISTRRRRCRGLFRRWKTRMNILRMVHHLRCRLLSRDSNCPRCVPCPLESRAWLTEFQAQKFYKRTQVTVWTTFSSRGILPALKSTRAMWHRRRLAIPLPTSPTSNKRTHCLYNNNIYWKNQTRLHTIKMKV